MWNKMYLDIDSITITIIVLFISIIIIFFFIIDIINILAFFTILSFSL